MRRTLVKVSLCLLVLAAGLPRKGFGQVITQGADSTLVRTDAGPVAPKEKGLSRPGKAALMSAIVPGLGQAYNKSYWKIPIIYATGGVLGYFLKTNHEQYISFRQAISLRVDGDTSNDTDEYTDEIGTRSLVDQVAILKRNRDAYRRWRDYTVLYSIVAYGLNITEAYVHAHLKGFDISEELTLKMQPDLIQTNTYSFTPAFSLSINLKK
jgi:hypothetical protein